MKNAIIFGAVIGILSGLWIWMMVLLGYNPYTATPTFAYFSVVIPFIGVYFGVKKFKNTDGDGNITFFEGMAEGFKILIAGGIITISFAILYISYVAKTSLGDFSGKIFGAFLIGVIAVLSTALLLMTDSKRIDSKKS